MKILVCGGRDFEDFSLLDSVLEQYLEGFTTLIHGDADGADSLADDWAHMNYIPCWKFPAEWHRWGNAAGPIRNTKMLKVSQPDLVIAFPGGKGTADMVKQAKRAGVKVVEVDYDGRS